MKKVYALVLIVVMAIGMTVPCFATVVSPNPGNVDVTPAVTSTTQETTQETAAAAVTPAPVAVEAPASVVKTTVADGKIEELPTADKKAIAEVLANTQNLTNLAVPPVAKLVSSFNFSYPADKIPEAGIQVPFVVSNAKAGDLAVILHRRSDGVWEKVGEAILGADLTVVGTFKSFSPVAIMLVDASEVAATGVKAPKTGEF